MDLPTKSIKYDPSNPAQNKYFWEKWKASCPYLDPATVDRVYERWVVGSIGVIVPVADVVYWQIEEKKRIGGANVF